MNPVETLRAAADHLDQLAASATGGTWWAQELSDDEPFGGWEVMNGLVGSEEHQVAATSDFSSTRCRPDALWIATLGPQVAPALSAWLRTEADDLREEQDSATQGCSECHGTAQVFDGDPLPFPCTDCKVTPYESGQHALTFARMVQGLPAGDAS